MTLDDPTPQSDSCDTPRDVTGHDVSPARTPVEQAFDPGPGKHVMVFADPMCSWCWGFAPEAQALRGALADRAGYHVVMGGLRPGTRKPWDDRLRSEIRHHWQDVQAKSGQPFDFTRLDDTDFVYDTEPACRALVSVRALAPGRAPAMFDELQRAFYADGRDVTDPRVLTELAVQQKLDRGAFSHLFSSQRARELVQFDFARTRAFGVSGFPTVLCAEDGQYGFLTVGYRPFDALAPMLEEWLNA